MATNTQRLDQLEKVVNSLLANEKALEVRLEWLDEADARADAAAAILREELERGRQRQTETDQRNAVLEATVKELKAVSEKWGQRWWQLAAGIALAVVGGVAGYLLKR